MYYVQSWVLPANFANCMFVARLDVQLLEGSVCFDTRVFWSYYSSKVAFVCKAHGALRASKDEKYNKTVKAGMKRVINEFKGPTP